jgi:hypothetical protein
MTPPHDALGEHQAQHDGAPEEEGIKHRSDHQPTLPA